MLEIVRKDNVLSINISDNATMFYLEGDFLKINDELVTNNLNTIEINTREIEDIDTAYLQFILSIINTLKDSYRVKILGENSLLREILELYGIDLWGMIDNEVHSYSG